MIVCVCVHRVGSGHYTAYGSHEDHWYHFNDSTVTLTNEDTVKKAKAYILFYVERTVQESLDTDSTATTQPSVDMAATDCFSTEIVSQDEVAADAQTCLTDTTQANILDEKAEEDASINMAPLKEAKMPSQEAAADRDTSEEALQTAAP